MSGRPLPLVTVETEHFWTTGALGQLHILRCEACGFWIHPPAPVCRRCHGRSVRPEPVSGRGTVFAYTINYHPWRADLDAPFVFASVELVEQAHLKVSTEIVGCQLDALHSGMHVAVEFLPVEDVWLPRFRPVQSDEEVPGA